MKIAQVSTFINYSVGNIMKNITTFINNNTNNECKIFYARGAKINNNDFIKFSSKLKTIICALEARFLDNDGLLTFSGTNKLIKQLKKYNPDIIHIHCLHGYHQNVEKLFRFLKYETEAKIIWTMHDVWAITGHCCFFPNNGCEKYRHYCNKCVCKNEYPKSIFLDESQKNYYKKMKIFTSLPDDKIIIISPSHWLKNKINNSYLKKYECRIIKNGIDTSVFNMKNSNFEKANKKILLGVASVWDRRKGLEYFLELGKLINEEWTIIVVGKLLNRVKFSKNMLHIDRLNNLEQLKYLYQNASIFFNPTLGDNYPTVNLEAQACGCKVLTFDTGGSIETDCGNLYFLKSRKIHDILNKIYEIDKKDINEINISKLSLERMVNDYGKLYGI